MSSNDHIPQEEFERIERYLLGAMEAEEQAMFEAERAADARFSQKIEEIETVLEGIKEAAFRQQLDQYHQKWESKSDKPRPNRRILPVKTLGVAATFLLVFGFLGWFLLLRPTINERLFNAYFTVDPGLVTAMGNAAKYEFDRGMVDYKSGSYQAAIERWETLLSQNPGSDTLQYFLGASHLALREVEPAITYLSVVANREQSAFSREAGWYLGLAYVLAGKESETLELLQNSEHPKAAELAKKLSDR